MRLSGKVAIVTGGAAGIGRAIARRFAAEGAHVALLDRDGDAADALARELDGFAHAVDVTDAAALAGAVARVEDALGATDILVNNAGISVAAPFLELADDDWRRSFEVNVMGVVHGCRAVLPGMLARRGGAIVNLSSWLGKASGPIFAAYSASKYAVVGLTQSLAHEVAGQGVRVNALCPGIIANTRMRRELEEIQSRLGLPGTAECARAHVPQARPGEPEEVAAAAAFLASDDASYMTGEAMNVSGGLWMH